jgi:hypothetical protein
MPGVSGHDHRLRRAVARAEDQVIAVEVELLDGGGEERQVVPIEPARKRQILDQRRPHPAAFDDRVRRAGDADQRKKVSVREHLAKRQQCAFAAPHSGQPVVNQRDLHRSTTSM